ncbi:MAG: isoprenylcysteine carboxylmethyltransferase family protein [Pseudomonadota bacterium]|jgi:protein-S-isoprenylcysteine O-methyltransferase Ste14
MVDVRNGSQPASEQGDAIATRDAVAWGDLVARAVVMTTFIILAILSLAGLRQLLPLDSVHKLLMAAARIANVMFLSLVAATALTRLAPIRKSSGLEPRISALLGTFFAMSLSLLPEVDLGPILSVVSTMLIIVGAVLSFAVLRWLGKSFSIMAEARRLVTDGPYRLVRHPLYICEGIALVGRVLQVVSPLGVLIGIVVATIQYRRMINEEAVLSAAFPEYRAYAALTPRVVPARLGRLLQSRRTHRAESQEVLTRDKKGAWSEPS